GIIDGLSEEERSIIPPQLSAICFGCIEALSENRYERMNDVVNELKSFQIGGHIGAYKYTLGELISDWIKKHRSHVVWAMLLFSLLAIGGLFTYQQYQREHAGWGSPIYTEDFSSDDWSDKWQIMGGEFERSDRRLVTAKGSDFLAFYKHRIQGGVAIELEGEILTGAQVGDLSIAFSPDITDTNSFNSPKKLYFFQNAGHGNECSTIKGPEGRLDYKPLKLNIGERYRIRAEIDGKLLRLYLNNQLTCSYDMLFPEISGYIGIYGYYKGKAFDNIKIYQKHLPEVTNIIKTGDLLFENNLFDLAIERYKKISDLHKGTSLGNEALYKLALSYYKNEDTTKAFAIWGKMRNTPFKDHINFYRWEELFKNKKYNSLLAQMDGLYKKSKSQTQKQIQEQWAVFINKAVRDKSQELVRSFLSFRDNNFPDDKIFNQQTLSALIATGEASRALILFPDQEVTVINALIAMGDYQDIVKNYPNQKISIAQALLSMGQYQRVLDEYADLPSSHLPALLALGRFEDAQKLYGSDPELDARILASQGKYQEIVDKYPCEKYGEYAVYLRLGQAQAHIDYQKTLGVTETHSNNNMFDAYLSIALEQYINSGDRTAVDEMIDNTRNMQKTGSSCTFSIYFLQSVLDHLEGKPEGLKEVLAKIRIEKKRMLAMHLWHEAGLLEGTLSVEDFMQQPSKDDIAFRSPFYQALHQDLYGDKKTALNLYRQTQQLAPHTYSVDLNIKKFVAYRIKELTKH
ncbi:MAG: hypothetical protein HRU15_16935, partial [Planctomycetes bacterium]|nr:hypothetical protein [Planctomycetota bacterium]